MKAAVLRGPNDIVVEEVPVPEIGPADVLIKVRLCGICGSDIHSFTTGMFVEPGQIMGHEFSGEIAEVGEAVEGLHPGDRVTGFSAGVCGVCEACKREEPLLCAQLFQNSTGYGLPGAFAEYVKIENAVLGQSVHKLEDAIDSLKGAMIEPVSIGVSAVAQAQVKAGDRVVVLGAGMIGNACLQAAKAAGAAEVIVVEVSDTRLRLARECGADDVFDARSGDALRWVMDKFGEAPYHYHVGGNADVVLEAAGHPTTIRQAFEMVRPGGRICFVGLPEGEVPLDTTKIVHKMPYVVGSLGGDFVAAIDAISSGRIRPDVLVTHRFALDDIAAAFQQQLNANETVKVMIEVA
jgi:2-desacetyl-2-hydroxyethyl bacteriochlorophyllide A dehydrogenase